MPKPLTRQQTRGVKNADGQRIGGLEQCASHESCGADNTDILPESPVVAGPLAPDLQPNYDYGEAMEYARKMGLPTDFPL